LELGISPSAAVCESLAVLDHEVHVVLGAGYRGRTWRRVALLGDPMDLGHLRAVRKWLAIAGNTSAVGLDPEGIAEDPRHHARRADGDHLPAFVSSEFGERQAARHLQAVL